MNRASLQRLRLREPPSAGAPRARGRRSPDVTRGLGEGEGGQEPLSPPPKPPEFLRVSDATRSHSSTSPDLCCDLVCHTVVPRSLALPLVYTYIYIDEKGPYLVHFLSRRRKQNTAPFASTPSWLQQRVISTVADSNIDHDPCSDIRLLNEKKLGLFASTRQERHTSEHNRQRDLGTGRNVIDYTGVKHIGYLSVCRCLPPKSVHSHPLQYLLPTLRPGKGGLHEGFIT